MTEEKETLQRVQGGLYHLRRGLTPFVEARMKAQQGANWLHYASRASGGAPGSALDEYGLLKTMIDNWREVFDEAFGRNEKHRVRNFTSMALEARNAISHLSLPIEDNEALRYRGSRSRFRIRTSLPTDSRKRISQPILAPSPPARCRMTMRRRKASSASPS